MFNKYFLAICILLLSCLFSCKHDLEHPNRDLDILTPIFNTSLSLENLIGDTILSSDTNDILNLIIDQEIYSFTLSDMIDPINLYINKNAKLDSLNLPPQVINYAISLGEIALQLGFEGILIIANNGNYIIVDPLANIGPFNFPIDASAYFSSLSLQEGYMDITFSNNLPIDASQVIYELTNTSNGSVILNDTIDLVSSNSSETRTYDLSGLTIEGDLTANVIQISSPGSFGDTVLIDTTDIIELDVVIRDLILYEATAIFPQQDLINDTSNTVFEVESGVELKSFLIKEGELNINITSTIGDKIIFSYELPSVTNNNNYLLINHEVDPAPTGGAAYFNTTYDLSGYTMDLTGIDGTLFNTFYDIFIGSVDSSGNLIYLSLEDSISLQTSITNLVAESVEGYLGNNKIEIGPEIVNANLYNSLTAGNLDINNINIELEVNNKIGADATIKIIELTSTNTNTNNDIPFYWDNITNIIQIKRAHRFNNTIVPSIITKQLNNNNSNIDLMIENLPDKLSYTLDIYLNPKGNISNYYDFIYYEDGLTTSLKMEMPLSLIANDLTFIDTVNINFNEIDSNNNINSAILTLVTLNTYPLETSINMILIDETNIILDTLLSNASILSGNLNSIGIVDNPNRSEIIFSIDQHKIELLKESTSVILEAILMTPTTNSHIDIYSHYYISIKLIADFNYSINN